MIIRGQEYRHKGNGNIYTVVDLVHVKLPNRSWTKGVTYKNEYGDLYVRTTENFSQRFDRKK